MNNASAMGNRAYLAATTIAHNLVRELTMSSTDAEREQSVKRTPLWRFPRTATIRHEIIERAGRLIRPQGRLTLSISANESLRGRIEGTLQALERAAWV